MPTGALLANGGHLSFNGCFGRRPGIITIPPPRIGDQPDERPTAGLTSLDQEQTSADRSDKEKIILTVAGSPIAGDETPDGPRHSYWQPASATERRFRHERHEDTRRRVLAALVSSNASKERLWRYQHCGSECFVEMSEDGQKSRLIACYCQDRFCPACGLARGREILEELTVLCGTQTTRFLTLTRKGDDASLSKAVADISASFKRLRETDFWKAHVVGGAWFIEITRGKSGGHWHVHLHVLCHGLFIPQRLLSDHWHRCSRTSYIVHVRPVTNTEQGIRYCCKYVSKPLHESVTSDHDALCEAVLALKGKRLWQGFGTWFKRPEMPVDIDQVKWKRIGRLNDIVTAAAAREPWAVAVLLTLGCEVSMKGGELSIARKSGIPPGEISSAAAPAADASRGSTAPDPET